MSEFHVAVVRIGKIGKHPNADSLGITQVNGAYPVIVKLGAFNPGDLAVHIPPDAIVDTRRPEFAFLADSTVVEGKHSHRVKFAKIRKVPSFGFLVPAPEGTVEGQDLREHFGITKYDPGPCYQMSGDVAGEHMKIPQEGVVPHYDIEGLRKFGNLMAPGEWVNVTEKIHGSNARFVYLDGELFCGSRTKFRKNSVWNRMAEKYDLEAVLKINEGLVLYGEVFGPGIQDLTYGVTEPTMVFFDVYDSRRGVWLDVADFEHFCTINNLPMCPLLYSGPYKESLMHELAEGLTVLGKDAHVREGVVIKPMEERWDAKAGRVFLKLCGEGYLLRKGG